MKAGNKLLAWVSFGLFLLAGGAGAAEPAVLYPSDGDDSVRHFGTAIGIHGDTIVVGARSMPVGGNFLQGAAYVYVHAGQGNREPEWREAMKLVAADGQAGDRFGSSVAIEDNLVVVGAADATVDGLPEAGAVYVFKRRGQSMRWMQAAKLVAADPTTMARFGTSIDIDGGRVAVGAPGAGRELGLPAGAVYVFDTERPHEWRQSMKLSAADAMDGAAFGASVALSGNTLAVGRTGANAVHVYDDNGSGWTQSAVLQPVLNVTDPGVGGQVELEGDTLVISAPGDLPDGYNENWWDVGVVHVYERGNGGWNHAAILAAQFPFIFNRFGSYLALQDGRIAVGESYEGYEMSVFDRNANGAWERILRMPFGFSREGKGLAVSGRWLANGSPESLPAWPNESPRGDVTVYDMAE